MLRPIINTTWGVLLKLQLLVTTKVATREADGLFLSKGFVPGLAPFPSRSHTPRIIIHRENPPALG